jgi:hypothetical protein
MVSSIDVSAFDYPICAEELLNSHLDRDYKAVELEVANVPDGDCLLLSLCSFCPNPDSNWPVRGIKAFAIDRQVRQHGFDCLICPCSLGSSIGLIAGEIALKYGKKLLLPVNETLEAFGFIVQSNFEGYPDSRACYVLEGVQFLSAGSSWTEVDTYTQRRIEDDSTLCLIDSHTRAAQYFAARQMELLEGRRFDHLVTVIGQGWTLSGLIAGLYKYKLSGKSIIGVQVHSEEPDSLLIFLRGQLGSFLELEPNREANTIRFTSFENREWSCLLKLEPQIAPQKELEEHMRYFSESHTPIDPKFEARSIPALRKRLEAGDRVVFVNSSLSPTLDRRLRVEFSGINCG